MWGRKCVCEVVCRVYLCGGWECVCVKERVRMGKIGSVLRVCSGSEGVSLRGRVWEGVCLCRKGVCVLTCCCVGGTAL